MSAKDAAEVVGSIGRNGTREFLRRAQRHYTHRNSATSEPEKQKDKLPPIVDVMEFLQEPLDKPSELIKGLLHKGTKMILGGASKSRKTWTLMHLGLCVAVGEPMWGFETTKSKVLYANFEVGDYHCQQRIDSVKNKLFIEGKDLKGQFHIWNLRGKAQDLTFLVDQVIDATKKEYDLIILDPIYKVLGDRDENSNGDVADLMNQIDRIIAGTGAAVVFAHHFSKGNQSKRGAMDRISGAGAFARDADTMLFLTDHQQAETYAVEIVVRNHKPIPPFCVQLDHPIMVPNTALDASKLKKVSGGQQKSYTVDQLVAVVEGEPTFRAQIGRKFREITGASEGTFNNLWREAVQTNRIIENEKGFWMKAPPKQDSKEDDSAKVQG